MLIWNKNLQLTYNAQDYHTNDIKDKENAANTVCTLPKGIQIADFSQASNTAKCNYLVIMYLFSNSWIAFIYE